MKTRGRWGACRSLVLSSSRLLVFCLAALPATTLSQGPPGSDTLSQRAVSESLAVLRTLDGAVRSNARNAAQWHHRGMLAWALVTRARAKPPLSGLDASRLSRTVDESLREAVSIEPDAPRYRISLGKYLLTSTTTMTRASAPGHFTRALEAARRGTDRLAHADAAIESGRVHWRRYDSQSYRRLITDSTVMRSLEEIAAGGTVPTEMALNRAHNILFNNTQPLADMGMSDYAAADALFREAYEAAPGYARAFRQLAMLLAEKSRWSELSTLARSHVARAPADAWAWLALGLARHRGGEVGPAKEAFDTGLERMDARERARLTGMQRVLRPADTLSYTRATAEARAASERTFWLMADQLWSRPGNAPQTEFLARVAYAELRWTVEELGVRGADSDRGNMFVRFGPPDVIAKLSPRNREDDITNQGWETQRQITDPAAETSEVTYWDWNTGLFVIFWGPPGFGTARLAGDDKQHIDYLVDVTPARWDNVATERIIPMAAYVARFRAAPDSVDIFIGTELPVAEIRAASAANVAVRADLWMFGRDVPNGYQDSLILRTGNVARWIYRVPPSAYLYRIEATAEGALVAGSVSAWIAANADSATGFATRGFGLSDILVGTRAAAAPDARRWDEIEMTPMLAPLPRNSTVAIIWENYEFGSRDRSAQYDVTFTLQRERSTAGRIAAEIVGALAAVVSVDRRDDRLIVRVDRTVPHANAFVDRIDLNLGATPPGQYRLEVRVTDRVSGRSATRATALTIRN